MAFGDNATIDPVKNQKFEFVDVVCSSSTGNPITGGLTTPVLYLAADNAEAFTAATTSVDEIGTSGYCKCTVTAAEAAANVVAYRLEAANANAVYARGEIKFRDLSEPTGAWWDQTVKRVEHMVMQGVQYLLGRAKRNISTGTITIYKQDDSTTIGTMSRTQTSTDIEKGSLS